MLKPPDGYESAREKGSPEERKAANNRLLAEYRALLDAQAKSANDQQKDMKAEREALETRLAKMTDEHSGQIDEHQQGEYSRLSARIEELNKLEAVAGELYDRANLAIDTTQDPDAKRPDSSTKPLTDD